MTSESNPETANTGQNGTTACTCDTFPPGTWCGQTGFPGDLVLTSKPDGTRILYVHDVLHRLNDVGNYSQNVQNACKRFRYDKNSAYGKPAGVIVNNTLGRLAEVATDGVVNGQDTLLTDEWFSYGVRGKLTDVYESTPHSSGYYHTSASYWADFSLDTLSGIPGVPTIYYGANGAGLDGEGRVTQVTAASGTNPVTSVTYSTSSTTNPLGALTGITFGS